MLLDPSGNLLATSTGKREIRISDPRLAKMAALADELFRQMVLTVVCPTCGGTPICRNHHRDPEWKMECNCAVRVMRNPDAPAH
jgi:hypothetical protein